MGQMNQMGQMGQMGQFYNAPYGGGAGGTTGGNNSNFYPMGGFQQNQNQQGNFQQGYGNSRDPNKQQKGGMNKNPAPKLDVKSK